MNIDLKALVDQTVEKYGRNFLSMTGQTYHHRWMFA
ncbi:hypothetical protein SAMN00768000_3102 [Sulfobacillus thermosulfidooxidans DSM 9293]|uniref:Uncharacterized protein n=1 Tax=Sulfobacillus thermosulfidooxidans (strain DSM 9293 / VKM B-1269 / AT-1) TaxID=929705 RepID=A0A1W1WKV6_SULTA|nr:hypothetical protein SAMN00768000_3102 [Sulfobacillus thermosulfidooxidans DSM 9293]